MIKRIQFLFLAVVFIVGAGWLLSYKVYAASVVTVTGYGDFSDLNPGDGNCDTLALPGDQCSLRAAIEELNAQGPDVVPHRIEFDISSGSGPFTITVGSELPPIVVPVFIDGETQSGAACPTATTPANLLIVLDGTNAGQFASGLIFNSGSDGSVVRGLVIGKFESGAIDFHSDENALRCSHIGLAPDGDTPFPNDGYALSISGDGNVIGGSAAHARRNVISGNDGGGMLISGQGNIVRNNYIGTTADGLDDLGNSVGIALSGTSADNYIGGDTAMARNVIVDHWATGINSKGTNNFILGNYIGVGPDGTTPMPNTIGITMESDGNFVGSVNPGEGNLIAHNTAYGIRVASLVSIGENEIRGNSIYGTTALIGTSGLGIDLGGDGVDVNDPGDLDAGPNGYQNYPDLYGISESGVLTGTLESQANTIYFIDFYRNDSCDPLGYGEGQELVYWHSYQTGANGRVNFSLDTTSWSITPGDYLTALATDTDGNTSEFSACLLVPTPPAPTATPTSSPTATATPSSTPTSTVSPTPTATGSPPPSATPTATATIPTNFPEKAYIPAVLK